jgi:hypothetical protein
MSAPGGPSRHFALRINCVALGAKRTSAPVGHARADLTDFIILPRCKLLAKTTKIRFERSVDARDNQTGPLLDMGPFCSVGCR